MWGPGDRHHVAPLDNRLASCKHVPCVPPKLGGGGTITLGMSPQGVGIGDTVARSRVFLKEEGRV